LANEEGRNGGVSAKAATSHGIGERNKRKKRNERNRMTKKYLNNQRSGIKYQS